MTIPTRSQAKQTQQEPPPGADSEVDLQSAVQDLRQEMETLKAKLASTETKLTSTQSELTTAKAELAACEAPKTSASGSPPPSAALRTLPAPALALKDLPRCSSDVLFTDHLEVWALTARIHLRAAYAAGAPLDELRVCLSAVVPKVAKPFFNDSTRWTQQDASAGFVSLIDEFIAAYSAESSASDDLDLFNRIVKLKFSSDRYHEDNVNTVFEALARRQFPPGFVGERLRDALDVPLDPNHAVSKKLAQTDLESPSSVKALLSQLSQLGYYRCSQCRRRGHTVSACYGRRGGWKQNAKNKSGRHNNGSSSSSVSGYRGSSSSRSFQQRRVEAFSDPGPSPSSSPPTPVPQDPPVYMLYGDESGKGPDRG